MNLLWRLLMASTAYRAKAEERHQGNALGESGLSSNARTPWVDWEPNRVRKAVAEEREAWSGEHLFPMSFISNFCTQPRLRSKSRSGHPAEQTARDIRMYMS